jgi:hypothetical protein
VKRTDIFLLIATVELDREENVCGLRLSVSQPGIVSAMLEIWVVEIDGGEPVSSDETDFSRQVDAMDDIGNRRSDAESGAYRLLE